MPESTVTKTLRRQVTHAWYPPALRMYLDTEISVLVK